MAMLNNQRVYILDCPWFSTPSIRVGGFGRDPQNGIGRVLVETSDLGHDLTLETHLSLDPWHLAYGMTMFDILWY